MHTFKVLKRAVSLFTMATFLAAAQLLMAKDPPFERERVYARDKSVISPSLIPANNSFPASKDCDGNYSGSILISFIVDSRGRPRNIFFEKPTGTQIDILALSIVQGDRFVPASLADKPVAVRESVRLTLHACLVESVENDGKPGKALSLRSEPQQEFSVSDQPSGEIALNPATLPLDAKNIQNFQSTGKTSPPLAFVPVDPVYLTKESSVRKEGTAIVELIADEHGLPQNAHIIKSFDRDVDGRALALIEKQRFRPAMTDGRPVQMKVAIQFKVRIYKPE